MVLAGPLPAGAQNQQDQQDQQAQSQTVAYRGAVLHFLDDPATSAQPSISSVLSAFNTLVMCRVVGLYKTGHDFLSFNAAKI